VTLPLVIAILARPFFDAQSLPSVAVLRLDNTVAEDVLPEYDPVETPLVRLNPTVGLVIAVHRPKVAEVGLIVLGAHFTANVSVCVGLGLASAVQLLEPVVIVDVTLPDLGVGVPPLQLLTVTATFDVSVEDAPALVSAGLKVMVPLTPVQVTVPDPVEDLCGMALAKADPLPTTATMPNAMAIDAAPMTIFLVIFTCTPPGN
jgi:hypothetical protein